MGTQDWKGSSEAGDILAAQKPPCRCACNSLILEDRDSPIYAAQNHMFVGNCRERALALMHCLCFARIKSAFTMNNIQRADVTLLHVLWMTKLQFATHSYVLIKKSPYMPTITGSIEVGPSGRPKWTGIGLSGT
jgi:hypothetical protein